MDKETTRKRLQNSFYASKFWGLLAAICSTLVYPYYGTMVLAYLIVVSIGYLLIKRAFLTGIRKDLNSAIVINNLHRFDDYYQFGYKGNGALLPIIIESFVVTAIIYGLLSL